MPHACTYFGTALSMEYSNTYSFENAKSANRYAARSARTSTTRPTPVYICKRRCLHKRTHSPDHLHVRREVWL